MLEGAIDQDGFDEVSEDGQPENKAEAFFDGLVAEEFLTGDRSWPAAEQRENVQRLLGNPVAFLFRSALVDSVDNEGCQAHHSEPDGADQNRVLTHCGALISSDANSYGQLAM